MPTRKRSTSPRPKRRATDWQARAAELQLALDLSMTEAGLPPAQPEYQFARKALGRRWAIDKAWLDERIALEIEGRGRHQRWPGYVRDIEKYNTLALMGWLLIRVTYDMIEDGSALRFIREAFAARRGQAA